MLCIYGLYFFHYVLYKAQWGCHTLKLIYEIGIFNCILQLKRNVTYFNEHGITLRTHIIFFLSETQMAFLQQQKNGLEKRVKELEAANLELMVQLDIVHKKEQPLSISGGMSGIQTSNLSL